MKKMKARGGVNPQEATIPEEQDEDLEFDTPVKKKETELSSSRRRRRKNGGNPPNSVPKKKKLATVLAKKRKKRNRVSYMATVNSDNNDNCANSMEPPTIPLPLNHYATTLFRRAIRKSGGDNPASPQQSKLRQTQPGDKLEEGVDHNGVQEEEYGDISLGMKLSVVGGKVVVQKLNALSDGRASPAQIAGVVQRGDVLLSIDSKSLVSLPIDLMMEHLKPMSTPDMSGAYQRVLQLRMAAGEGLDLLEKYEASEARKANISSKEAASDVFSLFPMVDHLSGMPLFDSTTMHLQQQPATALHHHQEEKKQELDPYSPAKTVQSIEGELVTKQPDTQHQGNLQEKPLDHIISNRLAQWRSFERTNFTSEYYAWNEAYSELLRPSVVLATTVRETTKDRPLTKAENLEIGRRALLGAETLSRFMENIDSGKDVRSFRSWNSSISLRSRASTRRRYVLDAVSLPVMRLDTKTESPGPSGGPSLSSNASGGSDMDDVDGDALLLRLAAHDEIWRSQVIEALENARDKVKDGGASAEESEQDEDAPANGVVEDAMAREFGAFLFGEALAKVVTKKKKSKALPPDEITAVLFDLSTNLASTMPDEVAVGTVSGALKSSLVPFMGRRSTQTGGSVILATRFVLNEALAVWLETFRPLPWESRRVLWPQTKPSANGESQSHSMFSDNDSLTLDSGGSPTSAYTSTTTGTRHRSKDLRQQIEDQELDVETRAETCFLVTYYFTQRLLPRFAQGRNRTDANEATELVEFVKKYGAYMKLHTCIAYTAAMKCATVIDELLALAEHDLRHREVIKLFSRRQALILYEPTMLSAIVKCLPIIRKETSAERRQLLVDVCVSAYPDLCPWQVRHALTESSAFDENASCLQHLKILYYYYLSSLLHPQDGHDAARHDAELVEEWCNLSLDASTLNDEPGATSRWKNFLSVASLNSSDHLVYHRDLKMLIELSMTSHEYHLALDLATEIVSSPDLARDDSVLGLVLDFLRDIVRNALDKGDQQERFHTLKRAVRLFQDISEASEHPSFSLAEELHALWNYKREKGSTSNNLLELIHFVAQEAPPGDFLQALNSWAASNESPHDTIAVLQAVLKRGTTIALNAELSGSLLRLRRGRQRMTSSQGDRCTSTPSSYKAEGGLGEPTVWSLMSKGLVAIDK